MERSRAWTPPRRPWWPSLSLETGEPSVDSSFDDGSRVHFLSENSGSLSPPSAIQDPRVLAISGKNRLSRRR
jgi:hypothetical protein